MDHHIYLGSHQSLQAFGPPTGLQGVSVSRMHFKASSKSVNVNPPTSINVGLEVECSPCLLVVDAEWRRDLCVLPPSLLQCHLKTLGRPLQNKRSLHSVFLRNDCLQ